MGKRGSNLQHLLSTLGITMHQTPVVWPTWLATLCWLVKEWTIGCSALFRRKSKAWLTTACTSARKSRAPGCQALHIMHGCRASDCEWSSQPHAWAHACHARHLATALLSSGGCRAASALHARLAAPSDHFAKYVALLHVCHMRGLRSSALQLLMQVPCQKPVLWLQVGRM